MKRSVALALSVLFLFALTGMAVKQESGDHSSLYYVCNCKDDCSCTTVSARAGKCECGQELAAMHLLAIEKSSGVFCRCGTGCSCERDKNDPGKCGCGKPVKTVSLTGKYVCSCDPSCQCTTISDKPGKCQCGKDLKKV
ncbi:MAG: hypothetical protein GXX84_00690 [Acidobacteria bacterium]|nr:hypothetical protein [Acidobacteriota bacterium]